MLEIETALRPGHYDVPVSQVFLIEREETANAWTIVVDEALGIARALRPFDWRVFPPKLVHADRLSDPLAENDVYEQEQSGLW